MGSEKNEEDVKFVIKVCLGPNKHVDGVNDRSFASSRVCHGGHWASGHLCRCSIARRSGSWSTEKSRIKIARNQGSNVRADKQ